MDNVHRTLSDADAAREAFEKIADRERQIDPLPVH